MMTIINEGYQPMETEEEEVMCAGICTEEPGDNCWLKLD